MTSLTHLEARAHLHHGRRWLDNKTAAALDAHLAACAECRAYAADVAALAPALTLALHDRWDSVQPPRPRESAEAAPRREGRRLSPLLTAVPLAAAVLLLIVVLPLLIAPPAATELTPPLLGLPSATPRAYLEQVLFAADPGTFSGPPEATHVDSPPRVMAWDPVNDQILWSAEVGLQPRIAVDHEGRYVFVVSQHKANTDTLAGLTYDSGTQSLDQLAWPIRLTLLDAATGTVEHTFHFNAELGVPALIGAVRGTLYLSLFGLQDQLLAVNLREGALLDARSDLCTGGYPYTVQLHPDGIALYALCWPDTATGGPWVQLARFGNEPIRVEIPAIGAISRWGLGLLLSHDGARLYVADTHLGLLGEIDTASATLVRTSQYKALGRQGRYEALMALSPNGGLLYLGALGGAEPDEVIRAVDTLTLETVGVLNLHPTHPLGLAARLDRLYAITGEGVAGANVLAREAPAYSQALPPTITQLVPYPSGVPTGPPSRLEASLDGRRLIAFESNREGNSDIFVANTGVAPRNLTQRPGPDRAPAWSPDGRYLAYLAHRGEVTDVMLLNVENALGTTDLTPPMRLLEGQPGLILGDHLEWSPDGAQLAITTWPSDSAGPMADGGITLLDVAAAINGVDSPAPLLAVAGSEPRFSPDGTRLLFAAMDEAGVPALLIENLATGERQNLTITENQGQQGYWNYHGHTWSPDGKFVAYVRVGIWVGHDSGHPTLDRAASHAQVVIAAPDGSEIKDGWDLSPAPNGIYGLEYSPDGQTLLFVSDRANNGCWGIHLLDLTDPLLDTLHRVETVCYAARTALPSWSPDGRFLLFSAGWAAGQPNHGTGGNLELTFLDVAQALADPAAVQPARLTHWVGDDLSPVWQP